MKRYLLTCLFCVAGFWMMAQDSIIQGVIRVRRPLEPAKFHVKVSDVYDYSGDNRHTTITSRVIVMSDSTPGTLSAQPYTLTQRDSLEASLVDGGITRFLCDNYPSDPFDWNTWLSTLNYGYEWNDSTRSDSALFMFTISADGLVTMTPKPWKGADASTKAFEKLVGAKMNQCVYWFPARVETGKKKKPRKNIGSTVLVTVYAEDAMAGRLKPLNVIYPK